MQIKSKILLFVACLIASNILIAADADARKITKPTERAVYNNNQGIKFLNAGDTIRAEMMFKTAIELSPDYVEAYNNLGIIKKMQGNLRDARVYFEKAIELDKNYASAISHLSMVYLEEGDLDKALKYGKSAITKGATLPITHYNLGMIYLEKGRQDTLKHYDEYAEEQFKIATELNPNMFEAHLALARLYNRQSRFELAAIRFRLGLENHPEDAAVWRELSAVYKSMGDATKADNALRKAKAIESGEKVTPEGALISPGGEDDKAISELKLAAERNAADWQAQYRYGSAMIAAGERKFTEGKEKEAVSLTASAIEPLKKAFELNPKATDVSYNLGLAYFRTGKTGPAEDAWERTLAGDPNHARALYNLGILYGKKGDFKRTADLLCKFVKAAGGAYPAEKEKALNMVKNGGGTCQN